MHEIEAQVGRLLEKGPDKVSAFTIPKLMLNAANLALVACSRFTNNLDGQVFVFFTITVAAAEVAVGLALIVALYRKRQTAHVEDLTSLKL